MHDTVIFAYNKICDGTHIPCEENGCFYNEYENVFTHINGDDHTTLFKFHDGRQYNGTLTKYDFRVPLETVLSKKFKILRKSLSQVLMGTEKFLYTINPRYLIKLLTDKPQENFIKLFLSPELIQCVNDGRCMFIINDTTEHSFYTDNHFSILKKYCDEANVNIKNIAIFTTNIYNIRNNKYNFNVVCWPHWECTTRLARAHYLRHTYTHFTEPKQEYKRYRMLLLNARQRQHRYYLCYEIWKRNNYTFDNVCVSLEQIRYEELIKLSSYLIRDNITEYNNYFSSLSKDNKEISNLHLFLSKLPLFTEFDRQEIAKIENKQIPLNELRITSKFAKTAFFKCCHWNRFNMDMYRNSDIHIVTETLAESKNTTDYSHMFITEKTYKPIAFNAPFIVLGQPNILKFLKQCGYKTFSCLWDESYDEEEDPQKRAEKVIITIDSILKLPDKEYKVLITEAKGISKYNYNIFKSRIPEQPYFDCIDTFLNAK
jgi:hypothetical protein